MKKKYMVVSNMTVKSIQVVILSCSFYLMPLADVQASNDFRWAEQANIESQQVEMVEHGSADFKIELMQNPVADTFVLAENCLDNLKVESPYPKEFELIKKEISCLPIEESRVKYMPSDPGFFFSLKLKDDVRMTIASYIDDEDSYVNIWKDGELVVQDLMPLEDLTKILLSYYDERS